MIKAVNADSETPTDHPVTKLSAFTPLASIVYLQYINIVFTDHLIAFKVI